jgi:uncharacterized protein (DUF1697 family)
MTTFVLLLRALNVGGTGILPMSELKAICSGAGFARVRTYIASGNVVLESALAEKAVKTSVERALEKATGSKIDVMVRSAAEIAQVLKDNPFAKAPPPLTVAIFLDEKPPADCLSRVKGLNDEEIVLGKREIYVYYPKGQGQSRLKIADAAAGTARNLNTVAKLAAMAAQGGLG